MENKMAAIQPLIGHTETFLKKLKAVFSIADLLSKFISRLYVDAILLFSIVSLNVGLALWLGDVLGKMYLGFLLVAAFYGVVALTLKLLQKSIKVSVNHSLIKQMLNE
jgi:hypothetical protein